MRHHRSVTTDLVPRVISACLVWVAVHTALPMVTAEEPLTLRILCYNIHHGEGTDGHVDLPRLAEIIREASPDLVALQEVDDRTARTGQIDQTAALARLAGMNGRFVHQLDYEGGRYGQAVLSRHPMSDVTVHWLPGTPDRERRIAGSVNVKIRGTELMFVTTHLHHNNEEFRRRQASRLNELFADAAPPTAGPLVILTGDLNATPDSQPLQILSQQWQSATAGQPPFLTFPADKPERQLDYVLFRPRQRVTVLSSTVLDEPLASDHRPLLVELSVHPQPR